MRRRRAASVARLIFPGRKMTRRPRAGAAFLILARRRRKRRRPAVQPKKEATRSCLRAAHTRMLHPSPHHPDLPGSLIAMPGRKLASPIISVLTLGLYENAKSHALDVFFLPLGISRWEVGLTTWAGLADRSDVPQLDRFSHSSFSF